MNLLNKQIEAVRKTKEQCVGETLNRQIHPWNSKLCVLCKTFKTDTDCGHCPLAIWQEDALCLNGYGCDRISDYISDRTIDDPQELACFLYSLELYLRERRHKHE